MQVKFLWIGKSKDRTYDEIISKYLKKLSHYTSTKIEVLKDPKLKSRNASDVRRAEAKAILDKLEDHHLLVLLDERGTKLSSRDLAEWFQHKQNISVSHVVFLIAGAHGADLALKERADFILSLSDMTLTHDMARMVIAEQVYRAFTILRGESYHND